MADDPILHDHPDKQADTGPLSEGADQEPPPLSSVRVRARGARGLNKPMVIAAAGGGVAVILVLASGTFTGDTSRAPAEARPMMSDPARPEMARGAVRDLPATYTEAQTFTASREPAHAPPRLGMPLPGDVAAFAPEPPAYTPPPATAWRQDPDTSPPQGLDPLEQEARNADRSDLFFSIREPAARTAVSAPPLRPMQGHPLTALGPLPGEAPPEAPGGVRALHPGTVVAASLVTGINSESPGPVIAQVTQAVYDSLTGRTLLIPQGARLMGEYRSASRHGQSRLAIIWSRLIMPDGLQIPLGEAAVDPSGAAGVSGEVDNHWGDVFGAAALGTLINIGVATTEEPQMTYGGVGAAGRDPADAAIADGVQRTGSIVTNRVVDRSLAIPPTLRVDAGTRISVIVTRSTVL